MQGEEKGFLLGSSPVRMGRWGSYPVGLQGNIADALSLAEGKEPAQFLDHVMWMRLPRIPGTAWLRFLVQ